MNLETFEDKAAETVTIKVDGSVDTSTAPILEKCLMQYYDQYAKICLDFTNVDYISSAGMRLMLQADTATGCCGNFFLKHVNADVKDVLDMSGFTEIIPIID